MMSDAVILDRLEEIVRAGERIELDHGEGNGFLAGSHVGPSLRDALAGLLERQGRQRFRYLTETSIGRLAEG
jgi:hypothetical protein